MKNDNKFMCFSHKILKLYYKNKQKTTLIKWCRFFFLFPTTACLEQTIFVGRAQKKSERHQELRSQFEHAKQERAKNFVGVNLYVKNLDDSVNDDKLMEAFKGFGSITSAKVCDSNDHL